jgi:hypothetical protein
MELTEIIKVRIINTTIMKAVSIYNLKLQSYFFERSPHHKSIN